MIYRIPILSSSSSGCPPTSSYASTGGFAYGSGAGKILTVSGGALSDHSDGTGMMGFGGGGGGGVNSNSGSQGTYTGFSLYGNTAAVDGYAINISGFVRANGAIALEGGSGGGGGKSTGALAVGGTGGGGGNGGAGGNNTTAAVNGSVPGGGGGGGPNSSNSIAVSAAGGNGQCIVIVI
jgi:hypothetical protein